MFRLRPLTRRVFVTQSAFAMTNSALVVGDGGDGGDGLLIDPGVYPGELAALAEDAGAAGVRAAAGFVTHAHWDHVLWPPALASDAVSRFASAGTVSTLDSQRAELIDNPLVAMGRSWPVPWPSPDLAALVPLGDGDMIPSHTTRCRVIVAPGHVPGHAALLVEDERVLLAGDLVSDVEIPLPDWDAVDPLGDYVRGLDALGAIARDVDHVVPGHGNAGTDLRDRIDADRRYVDALAAGGGGDDERLQRYPCNRDHHAHNLRSRAGVVA